MYGDRIQNLILRPEVAKMMMLAQTNPQEYKKLEEEKKAKQAQMQRMSASEVNKIRQQEADLKKKERL